MFYAINFACNSDRWSVALFVFDQVQKWCLSGCSHGFQLVGWFSLTQLGVIDRVKTGGFHFEPYSWEKWIKSVTESVQLKPNRTKNSGHESNWKHFAFRRTRIVRLIWFLVFSFIQISFQSTLFLWRKRFPFRILLVRLQRVKSFPETKYGLLMIGTNRETAEHVFSSYD